VAWRCRPD